MSSTFAELGVPRDLVAALTSQGITTPSPIQALTLSDSLVGRDVTGRAPTGSGKTVAFGIPLIARLGRAQPHRPLGLILVPTRELAAQVAGELTWLGAPRNCRIAACYGGVGYGPQRAALRRGVEVLVACPGRLLDLVGNGDVNLEAVEVAVVDEADRMADMGFLPEVRRILDHTSRARQTLLFSATLDTTVDVLVRRYQRDPVRRAVPARKEPETHVDHQFWRVEHDQRLARCVDVIRVSGSTIVFCRTKRGADRVARQLARSGVSATAIHGNRSQGQRQRALDEFAAGRVDALVATDVAARGLHVDDVACVVHFDPPSDPKSYTHRSGRTARAGATGRVVSLVTRDHLKDVQLLQRDLGLPVELASATDGVAALRGRRASARDGSPSSDTPGPSTGTVKWFDPRKGFGFIERSTGDDLFVHSSSIEDEGHVTLEVGQPVAFDVVLGRKGEEAGRVRPVEKRLGSGQRPRAKHQRIAQRGATRSVARSKRLARRNRSRNATAA